jgi:hypothetical protein
MTALREMEPLPFFPASPVCLCTADCLASFIADNAEKLQQYTDDRRNLTLTGSRNGVQILDLWKITCPYRYQCRLRRPQADVCGQITGSPAATPFVRKTRPMGQRETIDLSARDSRV